MSGKDEVAVYVRQDADEKKYCSNSRQVFGCFKVHSLCSPVLFSFSFSQYALKKISIQLNSNESKPKSNITRFPKPFLPLNSSISTERANSHVHGPTEFSNLE